MAAVSTRMMLMKMIDTIALNSPERLYVERYQAKTQVVKSIRKVRFWKFSFQTTWQIRRSSSIYDKPLIDVVTLSSPEAHGGAVVAWCLVAMAEILRWFWIRTARARTANVLVARCRRRCAPVSRRS